MHPLFLSHSVFAMCRIPLSAFLVAFLAIPLLAGEVRPWPAQYKLTAQDTDRLTPADVVGPDGIVYPNWTRTGVQGGIPHVAPAARLEEFGARADDDRDDSAALDKACRTVGEKGGGAILLSEGTYHLDWPVTVRHDGVVIRGAGRDKTRVVFRYALPAGGVGFYDLKPGDRLGRDTTITLHCRPAGLMKMAIQVDDQVLGRWERSKHSGNTFSMSARASHVVGRQKDGAHRLRGVAEYSDGSTLHSEIPVVLDAHYKDTRQVPSWRAAILFSGQGLQGKPLKLARDGRRGDLTLDLESAEGLAPGDGLWIEGPATERWKTLTRCACEWGRYRQYETLIEKIEGRRVTLAQPLRIDFPVIDGSLVRKVAPIRRCGVEDLSIEQTEDLWITTVLFSDGWNCWARGVMVKKCGRFPVYGANAKWCEIRDCVFDDAWFKGGGGTAYAGWEGSWDCLMENVTTYKLRHAPLFQWAASGNVIRKSEFYDSDAQWHAGWTHENLIEQCKVVSVKGNGGYGYGMWASPPQDKAHGPNGPRNVVYHCEVSSPQTGVWLGGMNENWLILYNRFTVDKGPGFYTSTASFDHILRGNRFVLRDPTASMIHLKTPDCLGVELIDNCLVGGNGQFTSGAAQPHRLEGNQSLPADDRSPFTPPPVPSIYEWQLHNVSKR